MRRLLAGGLGALLVVAGWLWMWQTQAYEENPIPAMPPPAALPDKLPEAGPGAPTFGLLPPTPLKRQKPAVKTSALTAMIAIVTSKFQGWR